MCVPSFDGAEQERGGVARTLRTMAHHLFLVEDHPVMREAYARVLTAEPDLLLCGEAESAEAALVALAGIECDLVITDVRLPGQSGIDLAGEIRQRWPELPVVVITGHEDSVFARRAEEAGAAAFLPKRLAATHLLDTIRGVLQPEAG